MSPAAQRETLADAPVPEELVRRVAAALEAGGVVALPTETVYGLAVRADHAEARARLAALKGRPEAQPLTWHVASAEDLARFPGLLAPVRRLAERYWPGPLTLVLPGAPEGFPWLASDGWCGVRAPAHEGARSLLAALPFPVVATSANAHGAEPLTDADAVERAFGDRLDLVLDGGPARLAEASSVLRVGRGRFELLREGVLDLDALRRTAGLRIAFVCTGNTCRSPMAEGLARGRIAERLEVPDRKIAEFGFHVASMGVLAGFGAPPAEHAVTVMAEMGRDIAAHRTRTATAPAVEDHDRVYCLTAAHFEALRLKLPPGRAAHLELLDPEGEDVPDPVGGSLDDYRSAARRILESIELRLPDWA